MNNVYVVNIQLIEDHVSKRFDTYEEAEEFINEFVDIYKKEIEWIDINEVEV